MTNKKAAFLPMGVGVGAAIGAAIGAATDDMGLWLSLGVAIGAGLGAAGIGTAKAKAQYSRSGDGGVIPTASDGKDCGSDGGSSDGGDGGGGGGD
ncbi:MAG: hypothetical protein ACK4NU_12180 [Brevundimonas sp.]